MKRCLLTLLAVMALGLMQAQIKPIVLGDSHAMVRVKGGQKYILLPVQESEDIAGIAVVGEGNNMVQRLNVKLAIDRVDYFVPYELKGADLLDITFHGDRRQKGAVSEFVCWREMKYSDTFDTTNRERFRPVYHHTPLYGWMNDPNGMFYKDGVWHLYYQSLGGSATGYRGRLVRFYLQRLMCDEWQRSGGFLHFRRSPSDTIHGSIKGWRSHLQEV